MIDKEMFDILACPACKSKLKGVKDRLVCLKCGRAYPVRDGIPVLVTEEGTIEKKY